MMKSNNYLKVNLNEVRNLPYCKITSLTRFKKFTAEVTISDENAVIYIEYFTYKVNVYLLNPVLPNKNINKYTHTYGNKYIKRYKRKLPMLCLTFPEDNEWNPSMSLLKTYIPWSAEWLKCYKAWELTGNWYASEKHPINISEPKKKIVKKRMNGEGKNL